MNQNNLWKFIFVLLVLAWSFVEIYPPVGTDLATAFKEKAVRRDASFDAIIAKLDSLQKDHPEHAFNNIIEATGTNDLHHYFPFVDVTGQVDTNRAVLNGIQRMPSVA